MNYRHKQQGVVLVIALIALVAISLTAVALMRTVDTSNVVSGNIAFNEAAIQMADIGAEQAYAEIDAEPDPKVFTGKTYYYPNYSAISTVSRLPTQAATWKVIPSSSVNLSGYAVQYMVERMCVGTANFQEMPTFSKCKAAPLYDTAGVLLADANNIPLPVGKLFYRITVQVNGPRNTRALSQFFYGVLGGVND
ncbi:MAG: hypothetical protein Q7U37_11735 [Gallionella sp.]|nr:hypothetical protein [Gallionella sp.]